MDSQASAEWSTRRAANNNQQQYRTRSARTSGQSTNRLHIYKLTSKNIHRNSPQKEKQNKEVDMHKTQFHITCIGKKKNTRKIHQTQVHSTCRGRKYTSYAIERVHSTCRGSTLSVCEHCKFIVTHVQYHSVRGPNSGSRCVSVKLCSHSVYPGPFVRFPVS